MKKFKGLWVGIALFTLAIAGITQAISTQKVRLSAQSQTTAYSTYHLICDSSDTFQVDTVYSETLDVGDFKYFHFKVGVDGFTLADSANDSVQVIWQLVGYNSDAPWFDTTVSFDTSTAHAAAIDSSKYTRDSLVLTYTAFDKVYWRIIVSDSFIMGAGIDTTDLRFRAESVQSEVVSR